MYRLEPEVAGVFGNDTIVDSNRHPPNISVLDYEFTGWMGDHLLETFPCFIASQPLVAAMQAEGLSGFYTDSMIISFGEDFKPPDDFPDFLWLKFEACDDADLWIDDDYMLCASVNALKVLNAFPIHNCDIELI